MGVVAEVSERLRLAGRLRGVLDAAAAASARRRRRSGVSGRVRGAAGRGAPRPSRATWARYRRGGRILELRGDDGASALVRSITSRARWPTPRLQPGPHVRPEAQLLETLDVGRLKLGALAKRMAELRCRRSRTTWTTAPEAAAQMFPPPADGPSARSSANDGSLADEYRRKIAAANMPEAVPRQAGELDRLSAWESSQSSMIRTYLDWLWPCLGQAFGRLDPYTPGRSSTPTTKVSTT